MSERSPRNESLRWRLSLLNSLSVISALGISFLVVSGLLQAIVPFAFVRTALDQRAGDGSADVYTPELHRRVVTALAVSVVGLIAGVVLCVAHRETLRKNCRVILSKLRELGSSLLRSAWNDWVVLALVAVLATLLRWPFIHLPMRFDESYTYLQYASQPLSVTVSKYDAPNNHVLHSVMVWLATRIGGNSPEVIRLPALICGVLTCVAAAWWTSRRAGRMWGLVAGCLVASSSILVEYSVNARGYTLVHLLLMFLLVIEDEWLQRPSRTTAAIAAMLAALALWTMPSAIYPLLVIGAGLWGMGRSQFEARPEVTVTATVIRTACITAGLTLVLYAPVLIVSGWSALTAPGQGHFDSLGDWYAASRQSSLETFSRLFRDLPVPAIAILLTGWWLTLHRLCWSRRSLRKAAVSSPISDLQIVDNQTVSLGPEKRISEVRQSAFPLREYSTIALPWLMLAGLLAGFGLLAIQRILPPPRTWLFVLPVFGSTIIASVAESTRSWSHTPRTILQTVALLICGVWTGANVLTRPTIAESTETGVCPEAEAIIAHLKPRLSPGEPVIAVSPASAPLAYYAQRQGIPSEHFFAPNVRTSSTGPASVIVSNIEHQSLDHVLRSLELSEPYSRHSRHRIQSSPGADVYALLPPTSIMSP